MLLPVISHTPLMTQTICAAQNRRLLALLRPLYDAAGCGERLEMREFPGVQHDVTEDMLRQSVDWLRRWLPLQPAAPAAKL